MSLSTNEPQFDNVMDAPDPVQAYFASDLATTEDCDRFQASYPYSYGRLECGPRCPTNYTKLFSESDDAGDAFLRQCVLYLQVGERARAGLLPAENASFLEGNGIDTSVAAAAGAVAQISSCLTSYCSLNDGCRASRSSVCAPDRLSVNGTLLDRGGLDECLGALCLSPQPLANPDIAGVGVLVSFVLQLALALLAALTLLLLSRSAGKTAAASGDHGDGDAGAGAGAAHPSPARLRRLSDAITASLYDFQKAQCFFSIAISVAALISPSVRDIGSSLDAASHAAAASVGILPPTFTLYVLAAANPSRRSWYVSALTATTWALAFRVLLGADMLGYYYGRWSSGRAGGDGAGLEGLANDGAAPPYPDACAPEGPLQLCPAARLRHFDPTPMFAYALCLPAMLGLAVWQAGAVPPVGRLYARAGAECARRGVRLAVWRRGLHAGALALFAAPAAVFLKGVAELFRGGAVAPDWGFGQVVAILVWLPTLAGFVNNCADGVGPALTKQLPGTCRVVAERARVLLGEAGRDGMSTYKNWNHGGGEGPRVYEET